MLERFDIELVSFGPGGDSAADLADTFGIDRKKAEAIIARLPHIVQRGVDEDAAQAMFEALKGIGAEVVLKRQLKHSERPGARSRRPSQPGSADSWRASPARAPNFGRSSSRPGQPSSAPSRRPSHPAGSPRSGVSEKSGYEPPLKARDVQPFIPALLTAFTYPFQITALAQFVGVAILATLFLLSPFFVMACFFVAWGFQFTFFFTVFRASSNGESEFPHPKDYEGLMDTAGATFRFLVAILIAALPVMLGLYFDAVRPLMAVLVLVGLGYAPASVMIAALSAGPLGALNIVAAVQLIARSPAAYAGIALATGLTTLLHLGSMAVLYSTIEALGIWEPMATFIGVAAGLYFPVVIFRMLGLYVDRNREVLGL